MKGAHPILGRVLLVALAVGVTTAGVVSATVLTNSNGVIRNSLCVGGDCPDSPSFGFDTIIVRENNLRILFDDTSNSSSFPRNDWRLEANSSTNGGGSYFAIQDATAGRNVFVVEAGAPSNALYVESDGDVGFGTSNPAVDLHAVDGDTPTLRLEQNGSSGFAPQTWDVAGNETNFFVRDVTNGSKLPFRIRPDAPSNSIFVDTDGDVGMGTSSPEAPLDVNLGSGTAGTGNAVVLLQKNGALALQMKDTTANLFWNFAVANGASEFRVSKQGTGQTEMIVDSSGNLKIPGNFFANNVQLNVPDYVFDAGYQLMPVTELAEFIEREGHLPNVPNAERIRTEGLNMTEMQMRLLEKVEELTLYTISHQKRMISQQERAISHEERIAELEEQNALLRDLVAELAVIVGGAAR